MLTSKTQNTSGKYKDFREKFLTFPLVFKGKELIYLFSAQLQEIK